MTTQIHRRPTHDATSFPTRAADANAHVALWPLLVATWKRQDTSSPGEV